MTRNDYIAIAIAAALHDTIPPDADADPDMWSQWSSDVHAIANVLAADNPRFDRLRFVATCFNG